MCGKMAQNRGLSCTYRNSVREEESLEQASSAFTFCYNYGGCDGIIPWR
ncbi:hypothetical protein LINGRAHAP2_LOCUS37417 [Linum grandiflorum]